MRIVLDIDATSEPPVGEVNAAGAAVRPFVGWLDLLAALEDALEGARAQLADTAPAASEESRASAPFS